MKRKIALSIQAAKVPATRAAEVQRLLRIFIGVSLALVVGCGQAEPEVVSIADPQVTVIGFNGEQRTISAAELYDATTGDPSVRSVLVIDRNTNRQLFVELEQLPAESQMDSRYLLVTDSPTATSPAAGQR